MTPAKQPRQLCIIGVGLLGGSIGLAAREAWAGVKIVGVGRRQSSLEAALTVGCVDEYALEPALGVAGADTVVLATPVGAFEGIFRQIAPALADGAMVTDAGSTKARVVAQAEAILPGGAFVGSHPMAGNENKGPQFATADLLAGALCIVTPTPDTPEPLAARAEAFWAALGMRTTRLDPEAHDRAVARVSHLPHALAALMTMLPDDADLPIAATGLRDTTRLAGGDPEMWRDIMLHNAPAVLEAIDHFGENLRELRQLVEAADGRGLERFFTHAKHRRDKHIK
jgi:prephenate dehydrogenase